MANVIKLKRGSGSDPAASDLVVGEIAIRSDTGKLFTKKDNGSVAEISGSGGGASNFFINTLSSSSGSGGGSASFNGTATRFTLSNPPSVAAQQLLVSINGVIQKPNSGTSPSEGFAIDGADIIFASAPVTGAGFFIITYAELAVGVPSDNSVTSAKIADGAIVNGDVSSTAAIAGSKISPDFGSQNITSGAITTIGAINIENNDPTIYFTEGNSNPDYKVRLDGGVFKINDVTNSADRFVINTDGHIDIAGNTDFGAGIDVTGNITVSGTVDGVDVAALSTSNAAKMPLTGGTFTGNVTTQKILPVNDSQFDIGENATRFANVYADTLYGDGSNLTGVSAGATGGGSDEIFYENSQTVTTDYTITSNKNAMSAGPITINNGVSVTVPSGSTYTIV